MKNKVRGLWELFQKFFFCFPALQQLALMRLIVSASLLGIYIWRQFVVGFYFSNETGLVLEEQAKTLLPELYQPAFYWFFWPDSWNPWMHGLLLLLLCGLVLGLGGRLWTLLTWILSLAFIQRNYFVIYGADLIGTAWLFYLSWTRHNVYFSVLNIINPERVKKNHLDIFSSAGARIIQIQLCIIYGFTGLHKLKGLSWWDGSALWHVLGNRQYAVMDLSWVAQWPLLMGVATFTSLFFEIYFPILVWNQRVNRYLLTFGVLFHVGIALTMGIWSFGAIMVSAYLLFLKESTLIKLKHFFIKQPLVMSLEHKV